MSSLQLPTLRASEEKEKPVTVHNIEETKLCTPKCVRNLISFWIFGLCNNYAYVIMLSAAHDILLKQESSNKTSVPSDDNSTVVNGRVNCTQVGTGAILMADIMPTLIIKLVAPFFIQKIHFHIKVFATVCFALGSFLMVSYSQSIVMSLSGVVFASISAGFGEPTFLSMTAFFDKNTVSSWSSGTGAAGVVGALSYLGLTYLVSPEMALRIITFVPLGMAITYLFVLDPPPSNALTWRGLWLQYGRGSEDHTPLLVSSDQSITSESSAACPAAVEQSDPSLSLKIVLAKNLLYLVIPLACVYFFEYLINQALFELLYFSNTSLPLQQQYRWYQVMYQIGVFISRSSVYLFRLKPTWIMAILQGINMIVCLVQVTNPFMPSIWILVVVILYEGLLGGLAYANTFYRISVESAPSYREISMVIASFSDSIGITLAAIVAVPLHDLLCKLYGNVSV